MWERELGRKGDLRSLVIGRGRPSLKRLYALALRMNAVDISEIFTSSRSTLPHSQQAHLFSYRLRSFLLPLPKV